MPGQGLPGYSRRQWLRGGLVSIVALGSFAACSKPKSMKNELNIFVAASMAPFIRAVSDVLFSNRQIRSVLNVAGSHQLATQLLHGAEADLFISANRSQMDRVSKNGNTDKAIEFARNELILVVNRSHTETIRSVFDLERQGRSVAMGIEAVPVGRYTRQALDSLNLRVAIEELVVTYEHDVRGVVVKVDKGEVDAGFVYRSELTGTKNLVEVPLPSNARVFGSYYVAVIRPNAKPESCDRVISFLLGESGRSLLREHGFATVA